MGRTRDGVSQQLKRLHRLQQWALTSESVQHVQAMINLARSEAGVPVRPADLDADPMLLNVLNGTIDLRTGGLRPHRPADMITKLAPVEYEDTARCPLWLDFLEKVFRGDRDLITYVQRLVGYCLTGDVREQALPIFWGAGSNGKSTLVTTVMGVLGEDYAVKAPRDLLLARKGDQHPTKVARLFGRRLAVCSELAEGEALDEALVKDLTGGDLLTARAMREDYWQFRPTHKVVLVTNHKPEIRGTDEGIWRRPRLVPFTAYFWDPDRPEDRAKGLPAEYRKDTGLMDRLRAELSGILAWAVEGCLAWRRHGLGSAAAVTDATGVYRAEQDTLSGFLEEECVLEAGRSAKAAELYGRYVFWCRRAAEEPVSMKAFGAALGRRGFQRYTSNGTRYRGIGLKSGGVGT
jgi:putative DNA primase/helicase